MPLSAIAFPGSPPGPTLIRPPKGENFLVAEVIIDTKLYPEGYNIELQSRNLSTEPYPTLTPDSPEENTDISVTSTIYTLPSTPLHSINASSPDNRPFERHLLRLTIPTAQYYAPTIEDPLTGEMRNAPEKPGWLVQLEENGGYVEIGIVPRKNVPADESNKFNVSVNGDLKDVLGEKDSLSAIGRSALEGDMEKRGSLHR
jgi:hypothetical protein